MTEKKTTQKKARKRYGQHDFYGSAEKPYHEVKEKGRKIRRGRPNNSKLTGKKEGA